MSDTELFAASRDGITAIRVCGRGTFKVSKEFCQYGERVLDDEETTGLIVDLEECEALDSTFMGVLAMLGLKGREQAALVILNASEKLRDLLDTVGVSRLWEFSSTSAAGDDWATICRAAAGALTTSGAANTVLEAHRTLMAIDPENVPRFKTLVSMLADELGETEHEKRK